MHQSNPPAAETRIFPGELLAHELIRLVGECPVVTFPDYDRVTYRHAACYLAQMLWDMQQQYRDSEPSHPCRIGKNWVRATPSEVIK